jgi:protein-tyrosine phosphatase
MAEAPFAVCFVCSGNICRSPIAEVVFRRLVGDAGLAGRIVVDSAGTGPWHAGDGMDDRARAVLAEAGYPAGAHVARQFQIADFAGRDLVVVLDSGHLSRLAVLAGLADNPAEAAAAVVLLRSYDPAAVADGDLDVPDPYYGSRSDFEAVFAQVERACRGLLHSLTAR